MLRAIEMGQPLGAIPVFFERGPAPAQYLSL
jgi:hypothetical protein